MIDTSCAQHLLDAAISWYSENDAAPIPKDGHLAGEGTSNAIFYSGQALYLYPKDGHRLDNIPGRLIPVLAAISVGFDSSTIARIIDKHQVKLWDVTGLAFSNATFAPIPLLKEKLSKASGSRIHIEMVKAHDADENLRVDLLDNASTYPSPQQGLAYTHAELSSLWPSAAIQLHAKRVMTPTPDKVRERFTAFTDLTAAANVMSDFPHDDPLVLARRAGMLNGIVQRKVTGKFSLWETTLKLATLGYEAQTKLLEAVRDNGHRKTVALALRGVLSSASDATTADYQGDDVLKFALDFFKDASDFHEVRLSTIFKLNTISLCDYPNELLAMERRPELYDNLLSRQNTLLSMVALEILSRPANELGYSEYLALLKLARMKLPPQEIKFSPERLINHVLNSSSTFLTPNVVMCRAKLAMDETVRDSILAMADLVSRHHNLDYGKLQQHTEATKILLIKGGLDVRQFGGLSRASRGLVLEHELGL